jgi:hypothetical protein
MNTKPAVDRKQINAQWQSLIEQIENWLETPMLIYEANS